MKTLGLIFLFLPIWFGCNLIIRFLIGVLDERLVQPLGLLMTLSAYGIYFLLS